MLVVPDMILSLFGAVNAAILFMLSAYYFTFNAHVGVLVSVFDARVQMHYLIYLFVLFSVLLFMFGIAYVKLKCYCLLQGTNMDKGRVCWTVVMGIVVEILGAVIFKLFINTYYLRNLFDKFF